MELRYEGCRLSIILALAPANRACLLNSIDSTKLLFSNECGSLVYLPRVQTLQYKRHFFQSSKLASKFVLSFNESIFSIMNQ